MYYVVIVTEGHNNPYIRPLKLNFVFLGLKLVSTVGGSIMLTIQ